MSGRGVLVTGASRGIGRACAAAFAAQGDRVVIHHRDSEREARGLLEELSGEGHAVVRADLGDPEAVAALAEEAAGALGGRIDVLVNNAGVYFHHPITQISYEEWQAAWRRTLDVNLIGVANLAWCVVKHMSAGGRIVNISSRGAFRGEPDAPAYGASKAALNAMGQSLAVALAPLGITVAAVAPGFVATDMTTDYLEAPGGDAIRAQSPFGRVGRPEEIAAAVVYLASPRAEWASGAILDLNGASYLR